MLNRKIGDKVYINPYSYITGTIIDSKEVNNNFHPSWDYKVKFNTPVDMGWGLQDSEYYNEEELDLLYQNWIMVKGK